MFLKILLLPLLALVVFGVFPLFGAFLLLTIGASSQAIDYKRFATALSESKLGWAENEHAVGSSVGKNGCLLAVCRAVCRAKKKAFFFCVSV